MSPNIHYLSFQPWPGLFAVDDSPPPAEFRHDKPEHGPVQQVCGRRRKEKAESLKLKAERKRPEEKTAQGRVGL
jgi:hypothetical protein